MTTLYILHVKYKAQAFLQVTPLFEILEVKAKVSLGEIYDGQLDVTQYSGLQDAANLFKGSGSSPVTCLIFLLGGLLA